MIDNGIVVALGLCIVFAGLISLIIVISIMGAIMKKSSKKKAEAEAAASSVSAAPAVAVSAEIPNKAEFIAAVAAAVAEEEGADVSRIRIHKIEKV